MEDKTIKTKELLESVLHESGKHTYKQNVAFHCPNCHHRKRKLEINIETHEYRCWVCNFKGKNLKFLLKFVNASQDSFDKLKSISGEKPTYIEDDDLKYKIDTTFRSTNTKKIANNTNITLPQEAHPLYVPINDYDYKNALYYMKNTRGYTIHDLIRYNVHFTDKNSFKYPNKIIIPSYNENGYVNYFFGRSFYEDDYKKHVLLDTSKLDKIFFENFLNFNYPITIVEGGMDAMKVRYNVTCTLGKEIPNILIKKIIKHNTPVNLMFDYDVFFGEVKASEQLIRSLDTLLKHEIKIHLVLLPPDKDPGDLTFNENQFRINNKYIILDDSVLMKLKLKMEFYET